MDMITLDFSGINTKRKGRLIRPAGRRGNTRAASVIVDKAGRVLITTGTAAEVNKYDARDQWCDDVRVPIPAYVAEASTAGDIMRTIERRAGEVRVVARLLQIINAPDPRGLGERVVVSYRKAWAGVFLTKRLARARTEWF